MREPFVLERLFASYEAYSHILQQIFLHLDSYTLKSLLLASKDMNLLVKRVIWKNSRAKRILRKRLSESWMKPLDAPETIETAFQCSDDVFDLKIRGDSILCGLRKGTVELFHVQTLEREMTLTHQEGSVQVDANDRVVAGVSSDSTVCVWDRKTGLLKETFRYHEASAWGISIQGNTLITGSMDGTIGVIDLEQMKLLKHFKAHDDEWGVSDLTASPKEIVTGCFGRKLKVWDFPSCDLRLSIDTGHAVNCVSLWGDVAATCSRTGKRQQDMSPNVRLWDVNTGACLKSLDLPSACFVQLDNDKLVCLVAAGDEVIGELHVIKWPIARILVIPKEELWKKQNGRSSTVSTKVPTKVDLSQCGEVLLRYQHTPAVVASKTMLVYTQPRTQGMCSVLDFWPSVMPPPSPHFNENREKSRSPQ